MLGTWTPGPMEVVVILVIALLLFGRRLPETGRSLGLGIKEFKKGLKGIAEDDEAPRVEAPAESARVLDAKSEPTDKNA